MINQKLRLGFTGLYGNCWVNVIPLVHSYDNQIWKNVYPVVAVKFGRGFLIHTGMNLDNEREYEILLDIVRRLGTIGYEMFVKSS